MSKCCECFQCARLGSCPIANGNIELCKHFIESKLTAKEVAEIIGSNPDTIRKLNKTSDGIKYLLHRLKSAGYNVLIEKKGDKVYFLRKEKF